jgi:hypothetical protein
LGKIKANGAGIEEMTMLAAVPGRIFIAQRVTVKCHFVKKFLTLFQVP